MDKEKKRKFHLMLYGIAIPVSLFALYTFVFVFDNGIGWKIALIIIGLGWLTSAVSGFIENLKKYENLIAAGEYPVIVDLETLVQIQPENKLGSDSSANEYFALEMFRLISGRHVSSGDKGKAVVSEELAKVNGLSLGDRISLLPNVGKEERETKMGTVEIIGIYEMIDSQKTTDPNMAECDMKENYIFVDTGFVRQVMGEVLGEEITAYSHGAVFYVEDVASLDQIVEQAEEIPGYYWKGYVIEKNNKEYHDLSEPLIRMDRFLMIFIAAICVCGVIILGLILIMWTRNRLHEAGILLSMGISRYAVAGQYLLENLLVMLGAYPIAWILGFLAVGPIGARMGLELQLDSLSILAAAGIGCGIVTVSTLLASVRIFRMEPKEILSMD